MDVGLVIFLLAAALVAIVLFVKLVVSLAKRRATATGKEKAIKIGCSAAAFVIFALCFGYFIYLAFFYPPKYYLDKAQKEFDESEYKAKIERILEEKYYFGGAYSGYYYDVTDVEFVYTLDEKPRVFIVTYTSDGGRTENPEAEEKYETRWSVGYIYRDKLYLSLLGESWKETPSGGSDKENPFIKHGAQDKKKYYFGFNGFGYLNDEGKIIGVNGKRENTEIVEADYKNLRPYFVKTCETAELK